MNRSLLLILYGSGALLFLGLFTAPLNYVLGVIFAVGFSALLFFEEKLEKETNQAFKNTFWLVTAFIWLANIFGFLALALDFVSGVTGAFLSGFVLFWGSLAVPRVRGGRHLKIVYSFSGALILAEFFWIITFFPFHYLTLAGMAFIVFYSIWMTFYYYLRGELNRKNIFKYALLGAFLLLFLLLTTRWQP